MASNPEANLLTQQREPWARLVNRRFGALYRISQMDPEKNTLEQAIALASAVIYREADQDGGVCGPE